MTTAVPHPRLQPHFEDLAKQAHAARLGMWLFLASELLLFSALFALYASYRAGHHDVFREAVHHTSFWLGAAMTGILITSSLAMALALHAVRDGRPDRSVRWLCACIGLGALFLVVKAFEYTEHFREGIFPGIYYAYPELPHPGAVVFFTLYYLMTGLHAVHVIGGLNVLGSVARSTGRRRYDATYHTPVELAGLYWHLVDMIWIFLWPAFYLLR